MSKDTNLYTQIFHAPRLAFGLSLNEYAVADSIYHLSANPTSPHPGWYYGGKQHLSAFFGLTRRTIINICQTLEEMGLIEQKRDSGFMKPTKKWYDNFVVAAGRENFSSGKKAEDSGCEKNSQGVKNIPEGCENISQKGVKKVHGGCEKSSHNNNTYSNNNKSFSSPAVEAPEQPICLLDEKVKAVKPKPSGKEPLHKPFITCFTEFYLKKFGTAYIFSSGADATATSQLIKKIKAKCSEAEVDETEENIISGFRLYLESIRDQWILDHFSLSIINSKFNELFKNAKNGTTKSTATDYSGYLEYLQSKDAACYS